MIMICFISCSDSCPTVKHSFFLLYNKQLNLYLCIPAKCFPPPYSKQTLAGSAMTCSHSQECFPSIKKPSRNKRLKTKEEKENTFFSLLALDRHKHKICPCIPLNEARQGLLNLSHTRMHQHACPFAHPLLKELLLGAE